MNKIREVIRDMHRGLINVLDKSSDERNFVDIIFIAVAGAIVIVTACVCELILLVLAPIWVVPYLIRKGREEECQKGSDE